MTGQRYATVVGLGSVLPERVVTNAEFEKLVDTSDEWIRERTGIRERHIAAPGETTSDLAVEAARNALDAAGIAPEQLDLIVCATLTSDTPIPSTAVWVQRKLGIARAGVRRERRVRGLLVRALDRHGVHRVGAGRDGPGDRRGGPLARDGLHGPHHVHPVRRRRGRGRASPLRGSPGVLGSVLGADGRAAEILIIPAGGSARPASHETVDARDHAIRMPNGREVFKRAVVEMANACRAAPREVRVHAGRRGRPDPPPGERPHHDRGGRAARGPLGSGRRGRRDRRQHVGGVDPDRAGPRVAGGTGPAWATSSC